MATKSNHIHLLLLFLFPLLSLSDLATETQSLLTFITSVPHSRTLNWNNSTSPCSNWQGITCDSANNSIIFLRLPAIGLAGPVPPSTISLLSSLRVLSLHSNQLSGPLPDLSNLTLLRALYLHRNQFSGQLSGSIGLLTRLNRIDLSSNELSGQLPFSLNNLTKLTGLLLQNNNFSGSIPAIEIDSLVDFSVANNSLNGSIPAWLSRFQASSFAGNLGLCGDPLPPCSPFFPSPSPAPGNSPREVKKGQKLSTGAIVGIALAAAVAALVLFLLLLLICIRCRRGENEGKKEPVSSAGATAATRNVETGMTSSSGGGTGGAGEAAGVPAAAERNRLVFVGSRGGYSFDLEDLLRASAEVLGKGSTGTSYKAVLEDGAMVVVKRLKDVTATKAEFEDHIQGLAKIDEHANLLPIRAYYYSNDEKLLVYDYIAGGSLSALLHGSRGSGRTPLDWDNRMRIALAAARGLSHLHNVANVVHGNVKASNILLHSDPDDSALSDYGLHALFGYTAPPSRLAGYRAPEVIETRRSTFKSDVYSFGVLLLELLTGKAPNHASFGDDGIDLPRWVQSVLTEEWTAEVFDAELLRYQNIEEEMVELLQIAMTCVATVPDSRPDISNVLRMMGEIGNRGEVAEDIQVGPRSPPPATATT